jgi:hypothetical protein
MSLPSAAIRSINNNRARQRASAVSQRISEVSRIAGELVASTPGLSRTEALRVAERFIPHA